MRSVKLPEGDLNDIIGSGTCLILAPVGPHPNSHAFPPGRLRVVREVRTAIRAHRSQYGDLITDDPAGFRLPPDLLSVFDRRFETFIQP